MNKNTQNVLSKHKLLFSILFGILLIGVISLYIYQTRGINYLTQNQSPIPTEKTKIEAVYQYKDSYSTFRDEDSELYLYIPTTWNHLALPIDNTFILEPKLSLWRSNTTCAVSYGYVDTSELTIPPNASTSMVVYGEPNYSGSNEVSRITIPFDKTVSEEEKKSGYTDLAAIVVPHFPFKTSKSGFVLQSVYSTQPLEEACVSEFNSILTNHSSSFTYPSSFTRISNQSNGLISVRREYVSFSSSLNIGLQPYRYDIVFEDTVSGKEKFISSTDNYIADLFLSDDTLFYMYMSGEIESVNLLTREVARLPISHDIREPIHAFFIRGDDLYYITGTFCNEYKAPCKNMKLLHYNRETYVTELLASNSESRDIKGFDTQGRLILSKIDADGGCSWGTYEAYDFSKQTLEKIGVISYCENNTDEKPLTSKIVNQDTVPYLIVSDGHIFLPSPEDYGEVPYSTSRIRVNTTEYFY